MIPLINQLKSPFVETFQVSQPTRQPLKPPNLDFFNNIELTHLKSNTTFPSLLQD